MTTSRMVRLLPALWLVLATAIPAALGLGVQKVDVLDPAAGGYRLSAPSGMARDRLRDLLVVADTEGGNIVVLDFAGNPHKILGRAGELQLPTAVAVSGSRLFIAEKNRRGLKVLSAYDSEEPERYETLELGGGGESQPVDPVALHVDESGTLYVADRVNRQVLVIGPDGKQRLTLSRVGDPVDVWAGRGRILVADARSGSIRVYGADGKFRRSLGDSPARSPAPLHPAAVTMDRRERVWVVQEDGGVLAMDLIGNRLVSLPERTFFAPSDVVLDSDGSLFVLERGGNRIAVCAVREF